MLAPAIHPASNPCAFPIPSKATPMVAMVVQELPVMTETMAQMRQQDAKNIWGVSVCNP